MSAFSRLGIFALGFAFPLGLAAAGRADDDPEHEKKKASEWVAILKDDSSVRKRTLAAAALAEIWTKHRYPDALKYLGRSLRIDSSPAVRVQCATLIAGLKPDDAKQLETELVDALKDEKDPRVRKELAIALGRFPDIARKAVAPLATALKDTDPAARAAAADALAKAGADAKSAGPELIPLVDDADKTARQAAIFALGRIAPENPSFVAAALIKRFREEKEVDIRRDIVVSLKLLGDKSEATVIGLAAALADPEDEVKAAAVATLGTLGTAAKPAADALLKLATESKDKGLRVDAIRGFGSALGAGLKDRLKDAIRVMKGDVDFEVRLAAVEELAALGATIKDDKEAMTALRERLSDPQGKVREAAAIAIKRIEKKPEKPLEKKTE